MGLQDIENTKLGTVGVRPLKPTYFFDFDKTSISEIILFGMNNLLNFDIYESSPHKYHLVSKCETYDDVQTLLDLTHKQFPLETYILNCRRLRLRIGPKVDHNGFEIVPAPRMFQCHCRQEHTDKRVGMLEEYHTKW